MIDVITPDELAAILRLSRRAVIESVSKQPGFPASVTGTRKPRWDAGAVAKFFKKKSVHSSHNDEAPQ